MSIFAVEPLTVIDSSRCSDRVPFKGQQQTTSGVREAMKAELEGICFGGEPVFRVWIHESEAVLPGDGNSTFNAAGISRFEVTRVAMPRR